jgi:hypothetical protein
LAAKQRFYFGKNRPDGIDGFMGQDKTGGRFANTNGIVAAMDINNDARHAGFGTQRRGECRPHRADDGFPGDICNRCHRDEFYTIGGSLSN